MADQNKKNQQEPDIHQLLKVRREKLAELQAMQARIRSRLQNITRPIIHLEVKELYDAA